MTDVSDLYIGTNVSWRDTDMCPCVVVVYIEKECEFYKFKNYGKSRYFCEF